MSTFWIDRPTFVTGGTGLLGRWLVKRLVEVGARVICLVRKRRSKAEFANAGLPAQTQQVDGDIRDQALLERIIGDRNVRTIMHIAAKAIVTDAIADPVPTLSVNIEGTWSLLEACRRNNPGVKVVFAGTRQVYGRPETLPVTEQHLVKPTDVNGINKAAGEYYHLLYNDVFGVRACSLRLTNVYGPRQLIKHNRQGFIAWFIRLAIENREIQIYGDGSQLRDFVYVDDAADAFLRAGATDASNGQVFNVGGMEPVSHRDLVELLVSIAGTGRYRFVEWPPEKKAIDLGDFFADSSRIKRTLGWQPTTPLREGLQRTIEFYRAHLHEYVPTAESPVTL